MANLVSVESNRLLYGIDIQRSASIPAVLPIFDALVQKLANLLAALALPASFAPVAHILPAVPARLAPHCTIVKTSLANHTGSFSRVFRIQSHEPYLCFIMSLPSEVPNSCTSITIVSTGFASHLAVALAVFSAEPGMFFSVVRKL